MTLSPKQLKVFKFIENFKLRKGYFPSQREIAEYFEFKSLGTVQDYLKYLENSGYIERTWNAKRSTELKKSSLPPQSPITAFPLPLLGKVAAGRPLEFTKTDVEIEVPPYLLKKSGEHYVLQVVGSSMVGEGILDGDFVVIRKQNTAATGETIVAMLENEATIKKFYPGSNGKIELISANPEFAPIIINPDRRFEITGILTGVLRKV